MRERYSDRREAGRLLAGRFERFAGREDVLVLALARGGVPVAFEGARRLDAPLGVFVVRKLGVPWHGELAMGAIASGGVRVLTDDLGRPALVVAVPVSAPDSCCRIEDDADEVVCLATPDPFQAVGLWYRDFPQTSDDEVRDLLDQAESFGRTV